MITEKKQARKWFIYFDNHHMGPYTAKEILELMSKDEVTEETLLWQEGQSDWKRLEQMRDAIEKDYETQNQYEQKIFNDKPKSSGMRNFYFGGDVKQMIEDFDDDDDDEPPPLPSLQVFGDSSDQETIVFDNDDIDKAFEEFSLNDMVAKFAKEKKEFEQESDQAITLFKETQEVKDNVGAKIEVEQTPPPLPPLPPLPSVDEIDEVEDFCEEDLEINFLRPELDDNHINQKFDDQVSDENKAFNKVDVKILEEIDELDDEQEDELEIEDHLHEQSLDKENDQEEDNHVLDNLDEGDFTQELVLEESDQLDENDIAQKQNVEIIKIVNDDILDITEDFVIEDNLITPPQESEESFEEAIIQRPDKEKIKSNKSSRLSLAYANLNQFMVFLKARLSGPKTLAIIGGTLFFTIGVGLYYLTMMNKSFERPQKMDEASYQELKKIKEIDPNLKVAVKFAFSKTGHTLWMSSNFQIDSKMSVRLESVPGRILSEQRVVLTSEGYFKNGLVTFDQFNVLEGKQRAAGLYQVTISSFAPLNAKDEKLEIFKKLNHRQTIFWGKENLDMAKFKEDLQKFNDHLKNKRSGHLAQLTQTYDTLVSLLSQVEYTYVTNLDQMRRPDQITLFEKAYAEKFSGVLQDLLMGNNKIYLELKGTDSGLESDYAQLMQTLKEFGNIVVQMIEEVKKQRFLRYQTKEKIKLVIEKKVLGFNEETRAINQKLRLKMQGTPL